MKCYCSITNILKDSAKIFLNLLYVFNNMLRCPGSAGNIVNEQNDGIHMIEVIHRFPTHGLIYLKE